MVPPVFLGIEPRRVRRKEPYFDVGCRFRKRFTFFRLCTRKLSMYSSIFFPGNVSTIFLKNFMNTGVFALADEDCTTSPVKGETAPNTLALFMWMSEGETGTLYQCSQKTRKNVIFCAGRTLHGIC